MTESDTAANRPRWLAAALLLWLALLVLATGFGAIVLLNSGEDYIESSAFQIVLCVTGGAFGAAVAALLRAVERIAQGWVDDAAAPRIGFSARLAPLLAVQPLFGAALGLLLYLLLASLVVVLLRVTEGTTFDPQGLLLVAAFCGLFARTLLGRVRDMFESLLGRARDAEKSVAGEREASRSRPAAAAAAPQPEANATGTAAGERAASPEPLRPLP